jgi:hypothetical protein
MTESGTGLSADNQGNINLSDLFSGGIISAKNKIRDAARELSPRAQVSRKISEGLSGYSREDISKYLDWLYGNISGAIQSVRRGVTIVVALIAAFELIASSGATASLTIFSVSIPKHSLAVQLIPAAIAFLYVQITKDSIDADRSRTAFSKAFEMWSNSSKASDLDSYIWPSSQLYWSPFTADVTGAPAGIDRAIFKVGSTFERIYSALTYLFIAQAYYVLFTPHFNRYLCLWLISLSFTLYCLYAVLKLYQEEFGVSELRRRVRRQARETARDNRRSEVRQPDGSLTNNGRQHPSASSGLGWPEDGQPNSGK